MSMPSSQQYRRRYKRLLPMEQQLRDELDRLERLGVIEKVGKPTDWVSRLVLVKKPNGTVGIWVDPKPLNRALQLSHYTVSTLDDVLPSLAKTKVFTVADVTDFGI